MELNSNNKARIDEYVEKYPNSKLSGSFPISIHGTRKELYVYRLPIDMLFYNIRNGRFAAEYKELEKHEGGSLNPENPKDAVKIKNLLLGLDKIETDRTKDDLRIRGQWNYGIITQDGYVIDGNRRMSIISYLHDETGEQKWKYLDVARLEESISPEDLWKLEAGIQLGKDEIIKYGPVNELLKIREGTQAGLSIKTIASTLYGYEEEDIAKKLILLDLLEQYLKFMGTPQKYSNVKNRVEHFINLRQIILSCEKSDYDPDQITKIKYVAFQLIHEDIQHLELRRINDMVLKNLRDAITEIVDAGSKLKPKDSQEPNLQETIEKDTHAIMDEFETKNRDFSETYAHFINAKDILDVSNNEGKELLLLSRAEKNLRPLIDDPITELPSEAISLIKKISSHVEKLMKKFEV